MESNISVKRLKEIKSLIDRHSARKKSGMFVVEGIRMVREIPEEDLEELIISESYLMEYQSGEKREGYKTSVISEASFRKLSDTVHPQGILAVVRQKQYSLNDLAKGKLVLILEGIQDPGNLGTIVRTAEAAGAGGILMDRNTADIYSPKVVRSTMGSVFRVPFAYTDELLQETDRLKKAGYTIYAAHLQGEPMREVKIREPRAILIGNEGSGLSEEAAGAADQRIRIPMKGKVESLNAAVAAALLMFVWQ